MDSITRLKRNLGELLDLQSDTTNVFFQYSTGTLRVVLEDVRTKVKASEILTEEAGDFDFFCVRIDDLQLELQREIEHYEIWKKIVG